MIRADVARATADQVNRDRKNAWIMLEKQIEAAMNKGEYMTVFKEGPGVSFGEDRKVVKNRLEGYGYIVEYRKYENNWDDFGNYFTIRWPKNNEEEEK